VGVRQRQSVQSVRHHRTRRQEATRRVIVKSGNIGHVRRPQYLLACFGARDKGTCTNHLTIGRDEVETRVLSALEEKLLRPDLFAEFCEEFTREMNRLRGQHRATLVSAEG
jgi:hypothetical protein